MCENIFTTVVYHRWSIMLLARVRLRYSSETDADKICSVTLHSYHLISSCVILVVQVEKLVGFINLQLLAFVWHSGRGEILVP